VASVLDQRCRFESCWPRAVG